LRTSPSGKRGIVFNKEKGFSDIKVVVPCGKCDGCRADRAKQWAVRCLHEAEMHTDNSFLTLTYDDENIPYNKSVSVREIQLFMKKLRKYVDKNSVASARTASVNLLPQGSASGKKIRFYACGEYGEKLSRPHYHVLLFGYDFPDKEYYKNNGENRLYTSESLSKIWGKGFCLIGDVTFGSAVYVARYIMKKKFGGGAYEHYADVDIESGEVLVERQSEFVVMSRRPGIGRSWYEKFGRDVHSPVSDEVVVAGRQIRPPRYYDDLLESEDPKLYARIKSFRLRNQARAREDNTDRRLADKAAVFEAKKKLFGVRRFENDGG